MKNIKTILLLVIIASITKAEECEKINIDIIKTQKRTNINIKFKNKKYANYSKSIQTKNKKIFKTKIDAMEYKYKYKKWYQYSWHEMKIENNVKTKYAINGNNLIIYIPENEKIENFEIIACKKYFIKSIGTTKKRKEKKENNTVITNRYSEEEMKKAIQEVNEE